MKKYKLVERYVRNERADRAKNTQAQTLSQISLVLETLERDYGVTVGDESVSGLTPLVMSDWKGGFVRNHKPATTNVYIALLRPFLKWLYEIGLTERDRGTTLKSVRIPSYESLPEEERPKDKYMTHEEVEALLNTNKGKNRVRDRAIMTLFLYTGLRTEELCSLNLSDFIGPKAVRGEICVRRKGGMYKKIPVPEACYEAIERYLKTRDTADLTAPLFLTAKGVRCNRRQLYKSISYKQRSVSDRIAVGGHTLRHTFVSEIEKLGGAAVARDLANHSSLHITNRYDHTTESQRRAAANALSW